MIVYEFYLADNFKEQAFDALSNSFFGLGDVSRKRGSVRGCAVYSVSRNPNTHWVQLLVDDNTPEGLITAIESRVKDLCDTQFAKYIEAEDNVAPMERSREEIGI